VPAIGIGNKTFKIPVFISSALPEKRSKSDAGFAYFAPLLFDFWLVVRNAPRNHQTCIARIAPVENCVP